MTTTISTKGQIVLPHELRTEDEIASGDRFEIHKIKKGEYVLRRVEAAPNAGLTDWLLACPVKDFFQPIPPESTDSL